MILHLWSLIFMLSVPLVLSIPLSQGAELEFCSGIGELSRRASRPSCTAQFDLPGERRSLCIPRPIWRSLVRAGQPACGRFHGKWKVFSPSENLGESKKFFYQFQVAAVRSEARWGVGQPTLLWMERERERLSASLQKAGDELGILRRLLLNEKGNARVEDLLRAMGFVHLYTASGIHLYAVVSFLQLFFLFLLKSGSKLFEKSRGDKKHLRSSALLSVQPGGGAGWAAEGLYRLSLSLAAVVWLGVWLLQGMRPGLVRPLIIVGARTLFRQHGVRVRLVFPLLLGVGFDLLLAGFALGRGEEAWAPGRLHYFFAVLGALLALEAWRSVPAKGLGAGNGSSFGHALEWRTHVAMSVGSWLLTAPLDLIEYGRIAPLTAPLSLVTIPILASVVYPLSGVGIVLGEPVLLHWASLIANGMIRFCAQGVGMAGAIWTVQSEGAGTAVGGGGVGLVILLSSAALLTVLFFIFPKKKSAIWMIAGAVLVLRGLPFFFSPPVSSQPTSFSGLKALAVTQLDVGQGSSALVRYENGVNLLIDTGHFYALTPLQWIEVLGRQGVGRLHAIVLTHLDEDHVGALRLLQHLLPIEGGVILREHFHSPKGKQLRSRLHAPIHWRFTDDLDGPPFFALQKKRSLHERFSRRGSSRRAFSRYVFPRGSSIQVLSSRVGGNDQMTGVWVPLMGENAGYLNLGDSSSEMEEAWLNRFGRSVLNESTVVYLQLSHHGSKTSSGLTFLRRLPWVEAWISAGVGNFYSHPHDGVVERVRSLMEGKKQRRLRRTDQEGSLHWRAHSGRDRWREFFAR